MGTKVLNLTQHLATAEQVSAGVFDVTEEDRAELTALLTFQQLPNGTEVASRAKDLAKLACKYHTIKVMVGGAPYLMPALHTELWKALKTPVYAFSSRESIETTQPDGSVVKTAVFRHKGFVTLD